MKYINYKLKTNTPKQKSLTDIGFTREPWASSGHTFYLTG